MKKLSIEEKAKAYDEALERAKEMIKAMTNIGGVAKVDDIQYLFPELKESEDERIWLTKYLQKEIDCLRCDIRDYKDSAKLDNLQRALTWLEKQGEHQHFNDNFPSFDEAQGTVIVEK